VAVHQGLRRTDALRKPRRGNAPLLKGARPESTGSLKDYLHVPEPSLGQLILDSRPPNGIDEVTPLPPVLRNGPSSEDDDDVPPRVPPKYDIFDKRYSIISAFQLGSDISIDAQKRPLLFEDLPRSPDSLPEVHPPLRSPRKPRQTFFRDSHPSGMSAEVGMTPPSLATKTEFSIEAVTPPESPRLRREKCSIIGLEPRAKSPSQHRRITSAPPSIVIPGFSGRIIDGDQEYRLEYPAYVHRYKVHDGRRSISENASQGTSARLEVLSDVSCERIAWNYEWTGFNIPRDMHER
jgi:hypothetical protein